MRILLCLAAIASLWLYSLIPKEAEKEAVAQAAAQPKTETLVRLSPQKLIFSLYPVKNELAQNFRSALIQLFLEQRSKDFLVRTFLFQPGLNREIFFSNVSLFAASTTSGAVFGLSLPLESADYLLKQFSQEQMQQLSGEGTIFEEGRQRIYLKALQGQLLASQAPLEWQTETATGFLYVAREMLNQQGLPLLAGAMNQLVGVDEGSKLSLHLQFSDEFLNRGLLKKLESSQDVQAVRGWNLQAGLNVTQAYHYFKKEGFCENMVKKVREWPVRICELMAGDLHVGANLGLGGVELSALVGFLGLGQSSQAFLELGQILTRKNLTLTEVDGRFVFQPPFVSQPLFLSRENRFWPLSLGPSPALSLAAVKMEPCFFYLNLNLDSAMPQILKALSDTRSRYQFQRLRDCQRKMDEKQATTCPLGGKYEVQGNAFFCPWHGSLEAPEKEEASPVRARFQIFERAIAAIADLEVQARTESSGICLGLQF